MKTRILTVITLSLTLTLTTRAQVPGIINYQGRIVDSGTNFTGTGQFEFALVNGSAGTTNYWSNDGTSVGQPSHIVSLTVAKGLYSVLLGDTTIANMTVSVPPPVFNNSDVRLRVWFNDGISGFQQLSPDQRLAAAGYAMIAANVDPTADVTGRRLNIGIGHSLGGSVASIAGGSNNAANGDYSTVGGGFANTIIGYAPNTSFSSYSVLGGGRGNGIQAWGLGCDFIGGGEVNGMVGNPLDGFPEHSVIGGGEGNSMLDYCRYDVIGGGLSNRLAGLSPSFGVIGGGSGNTIVAGNYNSILSGAGNSVSSFEASYSVIGGGQGNAVSGYVGYDVIGGGMGNAAGGGPYATVPGGLNNTANGTASFAAGNSALATNDGAFVWADDTGASFASTSSNQFSARAAGGVRFFSNSGASLGAQLAANATSWTTLSDRDAKEHIEPIRVRDILEELVAMPISRWNYKDDPAQRRYIGPMAQDFHSAFGLGNDDKRINTLDSESVALAAIQGLNQKLEQSVKEKDGQIEQLHRELGELKTQMQKISEQVGQANGAPDRTPREGTRPTTTANGRGQGVM